jgi:hypothetical protein
MLQNGKGISASGGSRLWVPVGALIWQQKMKPMITGGREKITLSSKSPCGVVFAGSSFLLPEC